MVRDVCYWMNYSLIHPSPPSSPPSSLSDDEQAPLFPASPRCVNDPLKAVCVNTAVEASTLTSRAGGCEACCIGTCGALLEQDEIIVENLTPNDYLVVSVGGNDIALMPSICTILALLLCILTPWFLLCRFHPGIMHLRSLFCTKVRDYLQKLTVRNRPKKIAVCMIYYPQVQNTESWANEALCCLCYCCFPTLLQDRISLAFQMGTCDIHLDGVEVVPVFLADVLDGSDPGDYEVRVEPSDQGGRKIAHLICERLGFFKQGL